MNDQLVVLPITAAATREPSAQDVWRVPLDRLLATLATQPSRLTAAEARSRLAKYGANDASTVRRSPLGMQFLARFRNPLVITLIVASGLSAVTGDVASFIIIDR